MFLPTATSLGGLLDPSHLLNASPKTITLTILSLLLTYYLTSSLLAWYRLRHFSGPFLGKFSYLWIFKIIHSGQMGEALHAAHDKYGGVPPGYPSTVRIGPSDLITTELDLIRRMSGARSRYVRSDWYKLNRLDPYDDNMFSTTSTSYHDHLKSKMAPGYSGRDNTGVEKDIDYVISKLVDKIRTKYATPKGCTSPAEKPMLEFGQMAQYFTLDVICKTAFQVEFDHINKEEDVFGYIDMVNNLVYPNAMGATIPMVGKVLSNPLFLKVFGPTTKDKRGMGLIMKVAREIVGRRFAEDVKDQQDMLGSFIRRGLTQRQCETESIFQILAGSDTTATAIRSGLLYLCSAPHAYTRLQREIDSRIASGLISSPCITNAESLAFPYLQAVIYESLRMRPPFDGLPFKVVPPEGDHTRDGRFIPGGTKITATFGAMQRNKEVFGEDADVWRPERWLGEEQGGDYDVERKREMKSVVEMVFGYGRWQCAGKMVAMVELNKIFCQLIRNFDFQIANPTQPWKSRNYHIFFHDDFYFLVTDRHSKTEEEMSG
ncbi:cytochrome P450 [Sordaria brevicollis]|uniref:Cytochrome P450 monooxygenase ABA1 n=1 Tax=Sordaria brevicollis TaxID=83679 RepID=A0AAE0PBL1_SORBR|nr:cytochrome P450 [Sordaria brevicollis]